MVLVQWFNLKLTWCEFHCHISLFFSNLHVLPRSIELFVCNLLLFYAFYLINAVNLIAQLSSFFYYWIFSPSLLSVSSSLVQVAEEIGTEARFQKDFLNQLVNHLHSHTFASHTHTHTHVYFLWFVAGFWFLLWISPEFYWRNYHVI